MEFVAELNTYKYCLTGEEVNLSHKKSIVGMTIEEAHPEVQIEEVKSHLETVRLNECIMIMRGQTLHANGLNSLHERIIFPLSKDGEIITDVIGATVYQRPAGDESEVTGQIIGINETYPIKDFTD